MRRSCTVLAVVAAIALVAWAQPASAGPISNLVANGSFESGLTGWTVGGVVGDPYPVVAIYYNSASGYPTGAFGEAVPPNDAFTFSPDPAGARAAYFVSDLARSETLSQSITVAAGLYQIGFSAYAPANGYANFYDASFSGIIASVPLAAYSVGAGPVTTWQTFKGATNLAGGTYQVQFVFNTNGVPAKDVVIDQVYMIEGNPVIPEPASLLLVGTGLVGLVRAARRRRT